MKLKCAIKEQCVGGQIKMYARVGIIISRLGVRIHIRDIQLSVELEGIACEELAAKLGTDVRPAASVCQRIQSAW